MAIKMSVKTYGKKDALGYLPEDLIRYFSEFTGRVERSEEAIEKMVQSLLQQGQLQPILYYKGFGDVPITIAGHTRILAADRINQRCLGGFSPANPFIITGILKQVNDLEALLMTFTENDDETRTGINALDRATTVRILHDKYNLSVPDIAKKLLKSEVWVNQHLTLLSLDQQTKQHITSGELGVSAALVLTQVAPEDRPTVVALAKEQDKKAGRKGGSKAVTERSVRTAARESGARTSTNIRRKATDLVRFMNTSKGQTPGGAAYDFLTGVDEYMAGRIDDAALLGLFAAISED